MEEKIRAKAINAKFDKDVKAVVVGYEAQILVLKNVWVLTNVWHSTLLASKVGENFES